MAFNVSIVFNAINKFSGTAKQIQKSYDDIRKKGESLNKVIDKTGRKFKEAGRASRALSVASIALAGNSIRLWGKQAEAIAQVETAIRSTGGVAGFTANELAKEAQRLQGLSLFGDEEILQGVTAQLLTFTNIAGDQFKQTQQAAIDLAARLKIDLKSASIQLGKALNDPIANLSALSRSGIQFSEDQKQVIKALAEAGRMAEAQNIILKELQTQYGGSAKAAAEAGTGGFKQMTNALGDAQESIGKVIGEALLPLALMVKKAAERFESASPAVKKLVAAVVVFGAVLFPVLSAVGSLLIGLASLKIVGIGIAAVFGAISLPVLAIVAAIAALAAGLIYLKSNWLEVSNAIGGTIEQIQINFENSLVGKLIDRVSGFFGGGESKIALDINVNDKAGNVDNIESSSATAPGVSLNVGQNMGMAL